MMESVAVTPGTSCVGDGTLDPCAVRSKSSGAIYLNDALNTWGDQKNDFIRGHSSNNSCITDDMFAFHLLEVHAKFCVETSCKSKSFESDPQLHVKTELYSKPNVNVTEPNPCHGPWPGDDITAACYNVNDISPCPDEISASTSMPDFPSVSLGTTDSNITMTTDIMSTSTAADKNSGLHRLKIEPPDLLSHDQEVEPDKDSGLHITDNPTDVALSARLKIEPPYPLSHDQVTEPDKNSGLHIAANPTDVALSASLKMEPLDRLSHGQVAEPYKNNGLHIADNPTDVALSARLEMGPPDPLSHDQVAEPDKDCSPHTAEDARDARVPRPSEVESCLDALPEALIDFEILTMLEESLVSPDLSHDQQRDTIVITKEERSCEEISDASITGNIIGLPVDEPACATEGVKTSLPQLKSAKVVLRKLNIRRVLAKCVDCCKALRGSSFQYSLDGVEQNIVMKCKRCNNDGTKPSELPKQAMDTGADIPREKTTFTTPRTRSRISDVRFKESGSMDKDTASAGKCYTSPSLAEVTDKQDFQEGTTLGTCRSGEKSQIHIDKFKEDSEEEGNEGIKETAKCVNRRNCKTNSDDHSGVHMRTVVDKRPHSCNVCSKAYSLERSLIQHMILHSSRRPFICTVCTKCFTCKGQLNCHMRTHAGEKPYVCKLCAVALSCEGSLTRHMRTHTAERPFKCRICTQSFAQSGNLASHMMTHTGDKPYKCSVCSLSFARSGNLSLHMRTHTGERPYKCRICTKSFAQSGGLVLHMRTHTGEKPFSCSVCKKCFNCKSHLNSHMRTHTGEKPHVCKLCTMAFSSKGQLTRHIRIHTGERPFSCSVCTKCFINKGNLKSHMMTHSGVGPHVCKLCAKSFSGKGDLTRHRRTHTGIQM